MKCFSNKRANHYKIPHLHINNVHYLIPFEVATQFAQHYARISSVQQYTHDLLTTLDSTLSTLSFHSENTEDYNTPFTSHELTLAIHKCGNTSVGPDQIAYPFFKNLTESGLVTLLSTINQLWESKSYPDSWRSSTLIPILKPRKTPSDPSSYRPISLTSCASKIVERMVNRRIRVHLESNSLLSPFQNGFRPGRSTADSLLQLIDSAQRGFQNKSFTVTLFLDLKNAFDKVNKTALMIKIHKIGIRGRMANFIQEFLKDRTFNVRCGNTYSQKFRQDHGLPQGSVISPTLFLIMINDLCDSIPSDIQFSLYADDVAIWCTHHSVNEAHYKIQFALEEIQNWCKNSGLLISPAKSAAIIFSHGLQFDMPLRPLSLNGEMIKYEKCFKYLGVTLDNKLNFAKHFEDVVQRCSRRLNILRCISGKDWGADRRTLLQLYTSLIRPILDYNGFLFDDIASNKIDTLQTIQNHALRIITGAFCTTNIFNLHIDTNIPFLDRRRKFQLLRFYARSSTKPNEPTFATLSNKHTNTILTTFQRKYPVISLRITRVLEHFNIRSFHTLSAPPLEAFWLYTPPTVHFLFPDKKQTVTSIEARSLFLQFQDSHQDFVFLYTDGSKKEGRTGIGITSSRIEKSSRLHDLHSIFSAELLGILSALHIIQNLNIGNSIICSDSSSSLLSISSQMPTHPLVYQIRNILHHITSQIEFLWVPGHTGIKGNETADRLAKESLLLPARNELHCPLLDILQHIHLRYKELLQFDWDTAPHFHLHPIKPVLKHYTTSHQNTRLKERVLARLRLGHTNLTHCHLIERRPPPSCFKCNNNTRYTIQHFLIDCPHLHSHRNNITQYIQKHRLTLDLATLLGDDHPELIDLLFDFLSKTRLINNI